MSKREAFINAMLNFQGAADGNAKHKEILSIYNSFVAEGKSKGSKYRMTINDAWCAATVSAAAIVSGVTDLIPVECSCTRQINLLRQIKSYNEDETAIPAPGWIVYYNWAGKTTPDAVANHVGVVTSVNLAANKFEVIEGNYNGKCQKRTIPFGWKYIHGFGVPKFADGAETKKIVYIVKPGDTLSKIAAMYGTTYKELAAKNGIKNPNLIHPGQEIII